MGKSQITRDTLLHLYRTMQRIRVFEETASVLNKTGEVPGQVHLYIGEEAIAAGVCAHLRKEDIITSTHRGHGHALAKGSRPDKCMAELFGRTDGYCGGRGGSMHIYDLENGLLGTNGMVGGGIPLAVGAALTFKTQKKNHVGVTFFGDGASNMGIFYESMNLAAIYRLPVVFICENNTYATEIKITYSASNPEIATRAQAFQMPGIAIDGNDVLAVYEAAGEAIGRARSGGGPTLIEAKTYRTHGHNESEPLYGTYRSLEEIEAWKLKCPVTNYRQKLLDEFKFSESELGAIDADIQKEISDAVDFSRKSPLPDVADIEKHVFAEVS
jgi:2-oxoisovalerate dehydrogenase E1 component